MNQLRDRASEVQVPILMMFLPLVMLLAPPAQAAPCDDVVRVAEEARTDVLDGVGSGSDEYGRLVAAARDAQACLLDVDVEKAAYWYTYEIWALLVMRHNAEGMARIAAYRDEVAGHDASADAIIFTYQGAILSRVSRLNEALIAYTEGLERAYESGVPYRIAFAHLHLADLSRRMNRADDVFRHLAITDSVSTADDFPQAMTMRARAAEYAADAILYFPLVRDTLSAAGAADVQARLTEAFEWASENASHRFRDGLALTRFEFERHLNESSDVVARAQHYFDTHINGLGGRREMTWMRELGMAYAAIGDVDASLHYLGESQRLAEEMNDLEFDARVSAAYARAFEAADQTEAAARWYRRADDAFVRHLREGGGTEQLTGAMGRTVEPMRNLAVMQLKQGDAEAGFQAIERARARFLGRLRHEGAMAGSPHSFKADSLVRALGNVRWDLARAETRKEREALEHRESQLLVEIARAFPEMPEVGQVDMVALKRKLEANDQVLLSYVVPRVDGRTDDAFLFVLSADTLVAVPLSIDADSLLRDVHTLLVEAGSSLKPSRDISLDVLGRLYDQLIAPAHPHIRDGQRLVIVPDGPLYYLPFAALARTYDGRYNFAEARFLIHDHPLSFELSAALYLNPGGDVEGVRRDVLALVRSEFDGAEGMTDLPSVREEARGIERVIRRARVLDEDDATPTAFLNGLAGQGVVHVATHATIDPASMLDHRIVLRPDSARPDGIVYAFDLLRRDFGTPLVVLSACATGAGPMIGGEGPAGFQYGFRAGGVGSVVATQWLVDDASMAGISAAFYRNLSRGLPKDKALQRAQLRMIERGGGYAHPSLWAAPMLHGDASPLPLQPDRLPLWAAACALLLLGVMVILRYRLRRPRSAHSINI